ncbi:hypothetical protein PR048_017556 [Dryococelus australis]|uniref:Uncharacterized protein n=1 Tax=Dryococelus australis TaxID=614101 RepID=A0ABQ9H9U1_9NEOP|nr:hypothetical protein PR048_017556 [Dryococelus australis]
MDCTFKLIKFSLEQKFSCARTKAEATVTNVLAPHAISEVKSKNLFPVLLRYFDATQGVQVKLWKLNSLPHENSDLTSTFLTESLDMINANEKNSCPVCWQYNCDFRGVNKKGGNNVFTKLKNYLGHELLGVGCTAHTVHNTTQAASDVLPVDDEIIVFKIYGHFHIYIVYVENLKDVCESVEKEYQKIMGYSKTRWLALRPAVERILQMFEPLKLYFQSQENCPNVIKIHFGNPLFEARLWFIHSQASTFHDSVKLTENENVSIFYVIELSKLKLSLKSRIDDNFLPLSVKSMLLKLEEEGYIIKEEVSDFRTSTKLFYQTALEYLEK